MLTLDRYVAAVSALGLALLAVVLATGDLSGFRLTEVSAFLMVAVVVGECIPMRIVHHGSEGEITTSSTFAIALLLTSGIEVTMVAVAVAAIVADLRQRKSASRALFNVGQYAIALVGAAFALRLVSGLHPPTSHPFGPGDLLGAVVAALTFFAVNSLLVARAVALLETVPFWRYLRADMEMQTSTVGILLGLGPILVITSQFSLLAIPLLALPLVALHRSGRRAILHQEMAVHDTLTGLPNRILLGERLEQALARRARDGTSFAVMVLDLDRFKDINDTLGHHRGDQLLVQVSDRLLAMTGESETVARMGGDEFAFVIPDSTRESAEAFADALCASIGRPFSTDADLVLHVRASIGVALAPQDGDDAETLVRRADSAMYRAKSLGGGVALYASDRDDSSPERLRMAGELHDAIRNGELVMHFQRKVAVRSREVEGFEALVRWPHPRLGLLAPGRFLDLAESAGLMGALTSLALDSALAECRSWLVSGAELSVAVNLSAESLRDERIVHEVQMLLKRHRVPGRLLQLELTEDSLVADLDAARVVLGSLRGLGVRVSIDDFGTGYSSLAHLKDLPVDELKIDRSFVAGLAGGSAEVAIIRSTIQLAHELGLRIVAEGVETAEVLERLGELGCDTVQGYLLGRPGPAEEIVVSNELAGLVPAA